MLKLNLLAPVFVLCPLLYGCGTTNDPPYNAEHCAKLSQQAEELKGKPQRRAAALQRYELECVGGY